MTVRRFVGRRSAETPLSKRALMKRESCLNTTTIFKVLQSCDAGIASGKTSHDFPSSALFSCHEVWFARVRSVVNNISKSAMHRLVCISAKLFRNITFTNSIKFIHIVTPRHNSTLLLAFNLHVDFYLFIC